MTDTLRSNEDMGNMNFKYLKLIQGSDEWLAYRRTKITSTDAAIIMGVDEYTTPFERYQQKLGLSPETYVTSAMRRGQLLEDAARDAYTRRTDNAMMPAVIESTLYPWLMTSLDGITPEENLILEIKCPKDWQVERVPECYWCQCQHHMICHDSQRMHIYFYSGSDDAGELFCVELDQEWKERYLKASEAFHRCIMTRTSPPLTERDLEQRNDEEWINAAKIWQAAKRLLDEAKQGEQEARDMLKDLANDRSCEGGGVRLRKSVQAGVVDYSKIPELSGINLEEFRKPSIIKWTITEKE